MIPLIPPDIAEIAVRLAFGESEVCEDVGDGFYSVVVPTSEALQLALRRRDKEPKRDDRLGATKRGKRCPECGSECLTLTFGPIVIGHTCPACKWEEMEES